MGVSCKVRQTMGLGFGRAVGGERSRLRFMYMVSLSWTVNMIGRFVGNLKDMSLGEVTTGGSDGREWTYVRYPLGYIYVSECCFS